MNYEAKLPKYLSDCNEHRIADLSKCILIGAEKVVKHTKSLQKKNDPEVALLLEYAIGYLNLNHEDLIYCLGVRDGQTK